MSNLITPGEYAPDFKLEDVAGNFVQLSKYRGNKPVILVFLRGFL